MTDSADNPLREQIIATIRTVYDPELPVNVYDLGLIYGLAIGDDGVVSIKMTLTTPGCPVADMLVQQVVGKVKAVPGVSDARVDLVWDPPWSPDQMSESGKLEMGVLGLDFLDKPKTPIIPPDSLTGPGRKS